MPSTFNIDAGNTVNLQVPGAAENLINLIYNEQSQINGVLNSIKNGNIGGHIFLVNPYGMIVGNTGVVNAGSLTVVSPAVNFMDSFFLSPGNPDEASVVNILNGNVPIRPGAQFINRGSINAACNISINTGEIVNNGEIYTGAVFQENDINTGDVVNINILVNASSLVERSGNIVLLASNNIVNSGKIIVDGGSKVDAGNITVKAVRNIDLNEDSLISAKGQGEKSNAGNIYIFANNTATFNKGAVIDASSETSSGDGGFIELSAAGTVRLNGGMFKASAINGKKAHVLIDPPIVDVLVDQDSDGADLTFQASRQININDGVTIDTRAGGNLEFNAPGVNFGEGTRFLTGGGKLTIELPGIGTPGTTNKSRLNADEINTGNGSIEISSDNPAHDETFDVKIGNNTTIQGKDLTVNLTGNSSRFDTGTGANFELDESFVVNLNDPNTGMKFETGSRVTAGDFIGLTCDGNSCQINATGSTFVADKNVNFIARGDNASVLLNNANVQSGRDILFNFQGDGSGVSLTNGTVVTPASDFKATGTGVESSFQSNGGTLNPGGSFDVDLTGARSGASILGSTINSGGNFDIITKGDNSWLESGNGIKVNADGSIKYATEGENTRLTFGPDGNWAAGNDLLIQGDYNSETLLLGGDFTAGNDSQFSLTGGHVGVFDGAVINVPGQGNVDISPIGELDFVGGQINAPMSNVKVGVGDSFNNNVSFLPKGIHAKSLAVGDPPPTPPGENPPLFFFCGASVNIGNFNDILVDGQIYEPFGIGIQALR